MMNFLKNNILAFVALLLGISSIYLSYNNKTSVLNNQVKTIINTDSIQSKIQEDYRLKIDSINKIHQKEVYRLQSKNKQLEKQLKDLNSTIGELPDFK
jgi:peptidoglycan hydrolase CwlO-like protein